ncbi:adenylate kinase family protein [Actinoallomurus iriomotensis]|uniref:adenylate kinase family protein n=1 Tax=Actinoallomurus iriomotensis TaxID=478107 RepID=UPI0025535EAC|nr:nucleoside monophosphate kinase [Actinoallomurus iriomotensis]
MRKYLLVGVPGSGKSTHTARLTRDFDLVRISAGDILRWHVSHHTKIGARVREVMAAGRLVDDSLVEGIMRVRLEQHDWNHGFVLDGFPRNRRQAEFFLERYDLDAVICLDVSDAQARDRALSRRLCGDCGLDYNLIGGRPRREGVCDSCGGRLETREDDTPEALTARIEDHRESIAALLDRLRRKVPVFVVDASRDPDTVQEEIRMLLGLPSRRFGRRQGGDQP